MSTRDPQWLPRPIGVERPDDPVLTMNEDQRAVFVEVVWYGYYLTGYNGAPVGRALTDRVLHPRVGDLVIIPDSMRRRSASADKDKTAQLMGVGYLVGARLEPAVSEEGWAKYGERDWGGVCPEEQIWYVQYGPHAEDVCRWENASCQAVPRGGPFADEVNGNARKYVTEVP